MNKKISVLVFITLFLIAATVFHYNGKPSNVNASDNPVMELESPLEMNNDDTINIENNDNNVLPVSNKDEVEEIAEKYPDELTIDNEVFVKIMDDEKFKEISDIARSYGAALYAIPYSDVFVIIKDEQPIFHMSAGVKGALPEYSTILKEAFNNDEYSEFTGLLDNIDYVVNTGKSVDVELEDYISYSIFQSDGWIIVSY